MSALVAAEAFDHRRPFTRAEGRRAGITDDLLETRSFHRVLYDSWVHSSVPITPRLRAEAAILLAPAGSRLSHHTAAELWGAVVPKEPRIHLAVPSDGDRLVRKGIVSHSARSFPVTVRRRGLPVSPPAQALLEMAAIGVGLVDLVVAADSMIKAGSVSPDQLIDAAAAYSGRGCRTARRAAGLARDGVNSPMETLLRLLLVLAGFPEPKVNLILRGLNGKWERRYDLAYEAIRLIIEYDGRQHNRDEVQWRTDIFRREELDRRRWRLVVVISEGIFSDPLNTLNRVRTAMIDCGAVDAPKRFKDEWRLHFPGA